MSGGVEATVWPRTPAGEPGRTPLAHGVFVDDAGAHEFIAHQMQTLPARGVDDVMIQLVTIDGAGPARPTRNIVGSTSSVLADLDHPDQAAHAIASVLTRTAQTRSVDVAAVLELAAASAAANVSGTDTLLAASPHSARRRTSPHSRRSGPIRSCRRRSGRLRWCSTSRPATNNSPTMASTNCGNGIG